VADQDKDVMRYELDISDVESKPKRILELTAQIKAAKASGGNARMNPAYDAKAAAPGSGIMDRSQS